MLLAISKYDKQIEASKKEDGFCPMCKGKLIPKMGNIKIHHWAHISSDCDDWKEPESYWHLSWKKRFGLENCERVVGSHRADIVIDDMVIEIQSSSIPQDSAIERENFYIENGFKFSWLLNMETFGKEFFYSVKADGQCHFKWSRFPKSFNRAWGKVSVFIDTGNGHIVKIKSWNQCSDFKTYNNYGMNIDYDKLSFEGICKIMTYEDFGNLIFGFKNEEQHETNPQKN